VPVLAALLGAASLGLAQSPYLGVACPYSNSTSCGRIGISVSLKRPALGVDAVLAGRRVRLRTGPFVLAGHGPRFWQNYVHLDRRQLGLPLYWSGSHPVKYLTLRLVVRYATGTVRGTVRVLLHPGWG
jgi:hypothetical protein